MFASILVWAFFVVCFLCNCNFSDFQISSTQPNQGKLNLENWDPMQDKMLELDGEWEFYWEKIIDPEDFKLTNLEARYLAPGARWATLPISGKEPNGTGFATYRLNLLLAKKHIGSVLGLKFKTTGGAAYKIFVNGKLCQELGKLGKTRDSMTPTRKNAILYFPVFSAENEIVIQISNFFHADGSFWYPPVLGSAERISSYTIKKQFIDATLLGSIFIMALYHLSIFFHRRKDLTSLYFGLFCFLVCMYVISVDEVFIYSIVNNIPYKLIYLIHLSYFVGVPLYLSFLKCLFPEDISKWIVRITWFFGLGSYLFNVFFDPVIGSLLQRPFISVILISFSYALFSVVLALIRRRTDSFFIFLPNLIFVLSAINDTLSLYSYINTPFTLNFSIFIFINAQSILLSRRFSRAFNQVESLSKELNNLNASLEKTVEDRTLQYREAKTKAEEANLWKDKLIALVSHDLRSPLSSIAGSLDLLEDEMDEKEKNSLIKETKNLLNELISTVSHLLNLSRFPQGGIQLNIREVFLSSIIKSLFLGLRYNLESKNILLKNLIPSNISINADESIVAEILRNLLHNAVKFSNDGGQIFIEYSKEDTFHLIHVVDHGIGISEEMLQTILKKEISKLGTKGERGFGIGLKLCSELVELHGGKIIIQSKVGLGSRFTVYFPA